MNGINGNTLSDILPPGTTRLAFGCGGLMCDINHTGSRRLLETAIDCGITYFDTARMYGVGLSEGVLGELLPRYRDRVIVASKAGILPASRSIPLRAWNRGVKELHQAIPALKSVVPRPAGVDPKFGVFDLADIRKSLEKSLRELRTDYLDVFLLHECKPEDVSNPELFEFLQGLQSEGKIRTFGLATGIEETLQIMQTSPQLSRIVQIPSNIWNLNVKRLPDRARRRTITHSTLTHQFHVLASRLAFDAALAKTWQSQIQIDPRDKSALAQLLLAHALHSNPDGLVIFFSTKPENIRTAARVAAAPFDMAQVNGLNSLIQNEMAVQ
jgi:D-threo-aldose 1-dehydrogenase